MLNTDYLRELLGAQHGETLFEAAERVVRERDQLAMKLRKANDDLEDNFVYFHCDTCCEQCSNN